MWVDYDEYINSSEWQQLAEEAKALAGYRCRVCNRHARDVVLNAHHRTYERFGDERLDDITVLCCDCHELYATHGRFPKKPRWKYTVSDSAQGHALYTAAIVPPKSRKAVIPAAATATPSLIQPPPVPAAQSIQSTPAPQAPHHAGSHTPFVLATIALLIASAALFATWWSLRNQTIESVRWIPAQSTPMQSTPVQSTLMQSTLMQSTPMQSTPVQSTLMQSTLMQSAPMQSTPVPLTATAALATSTPAPTVPAAPALTRITLPSAPLQFDPSGREADIPSAQAGAGVGLAATLTAIAHPMTHPRLSDSPPALTTETTAIATPVERGCPGGCTTYPSWCAMVVKGSVSYSTGEKIYHLPGQEYYNDTVITPSYGERWFCTEEEARTAGWRKAWQ